MSKSIKSKGKKEIAPEQIWDEKDLDQVRSYLKVHSRNQNIEDRLNIEIKAIQYQIEDYIQSEEVKEIKPIFVFIKQYLKLLRMTQKEFAEILEVRDANLYKYLKGERKLNADLVFKISAFSHTRPELWFHLETKNTLIALKRNKGTSKKYEKYAFEKHIFKRI